MRHSVYHRNGQGNRRALRGLRPVWIIVLLAALVLEGCQLLPGRQALGPVRKSVAAAKAMLASSRTERAAASQSSDLSAGVAAASVVVAAAAPVTTSPAAGNSAEPVPATNSVVLASVPILGSNLAGGWETQHSWNAQLAKSRNPGPAGSSAAAADAWKVAFTQDNGGVFFAVKQDTPQRYLGANYLAGRVWINPGAHDLPVDRLSVAVLSSDRHAYWTQDDQAVPPPDPTTTGEARLAVPGAALPANTWTEALIWFRRLPALPHGRYLTGLYLRANAMAGQAIEIAGLELLAIPDNIRPVPLSVAIVDLTSLRVNFNEDVDLVTVEKPDNYRISSAGDPAYSTPRPPASVQYQPDTMSAVLAVPEALKPGVQYTIEVQRITDFAVPPHVQAEPARLALTANALVVTVDAAHPSHPISPMIYGIAGGTPEYIKALRPTVDNWGGNASSRYNWQLGNAWNAASDWEYRNGDYGYKGQSASDEFVAAAQAAGAEVRMTLPMLGWVAKNTDNNTCSFVGPDGKCTNPQANCQKPGPVADPNRANVPVDANWVVQWVKHMINEKGLRVRFFAFDNEPDLWGYTHYDVHPKCTSYDEILNKYLEYATAVRAAAPQAELLGPVSCCWYFYWNSSAGQVDKAKHGNQDFLPWFLDQVRQHDQKAGVRTLDALDIHYYPEGIYNDKADAATAQARLQATRSLWDKNYVDPSWIAQPVNLIPRMKQLTADHYPGTQIFLSEWNFGADKTMNGALALADALGIFGQENLYAASYWRFPEQDSPGFFGFKMFTNFDDQGGHFGDTALPATSSNRDQVSVYASRDSRTGNTLLMLINKLPDRPIPVTFQLDGVTGGQSDLYRYSQDHPDGITHERGAWNAGSPVTLPPYSITLLVISQ